MPEVYGEIPRQEVPEAKVAEFKERAKKFIKEADEMSLEVLARTLDDTYTGKIDAQEILKTKNPTKLADKAREQVEARELYGEIVEAIWPQG